ncbi:Upstream activation factor subunit spp27-like protein [Drosera capensis]
MATSSSLGTLIAKSRSILSTTNPAASFATTAAAGASKPKPLPKKPAAPKRAASASASSGEKPARGILKLVPVSAQLGKFLGAEEASRPFAVKKVWEHIKLNNLQDAKSKRLIHCDEKLKTIFDGKDSVEFLEVSRLLSQHFRKAVV